jgi:hypothetical protein
MKALLKHSAIAAALGLLSLVLVYVATIILMSVFMGGMLEGDNLYVNDWAYLFRSMAVMVIGFLIVLVLSGFAASFLASRQAASPLYMIKAASLTGFFIMATLILIVFGASVSGALLSQSVPLLDKISGIISVQAMCCPGYLLILLFGIVLTAAGSVTFIGAQRLYGWLVKRRPF